MPILGRGRVLSPARWSSRRTRRGRIRGSGADAVRPNRWHWRTRSCSFPWNMSGPLRRAANDVWRSAARQGNRRTEGPTSPGRSLVACLSLGCAPQAAAVGDYTVDRQDVTRYLGNMANHFFTLVLKGRVKIARGQTPFPPRPAVCFPSGIFNKTHLLSSQSLAYMQGILRFTQCNSK